MEDEAPLHGAKSPLEFVYPYGATINVQKPATPVLSSGPISYPLNRPVCAVYEHNKQEQGGGQGGRLCVVGSYQMFQDEYLDKEHNGKLADLLVRWLLGLSDCDLSFKYGEEADISE